jgi:outer membrane lipase/esterase
MIFHLFLFSRPVMTSFSTSLLCSSRRTWARTASAIGVATALVAALGLSACGSGDVVSAIQPERFIAFGDGASDLGQAGGRYTVNDGSVNTWADKLAGRYGKTITAQAAGGLGYARGHAVDQAPTVTVSAQIDQFLAGQTLGGNDVVLINLPMTDVLTSAAAVKAGTLTEASALNQADAAGRSHATQVKRLIAAGAKYIVVAGVYDLGKSPWANNQNQQGLLSALTLKLNDAFKTEAVNLGQNLLYIDAAFVVNRSVLTPSNFGFINATDMVCTTPSALTCTPSTLVSGADAARYVFADLVHTTPALNQQMGDYAYDQMHARW